MSGHRFFVPPETLAADTLRLPDDVAHQVAHVLRLHAGERVVLLGGGLEHEVELVAVARSGVTVRVVATRPATGEPRLRLTLCPALLKADKFEWVLQKCTELGVAAFQPVISARCVSDAASARKMARWQRIVQEAAEQSGRGIVPPVAEPIALDKLPVEAAIATLMAYEQEHRRGLRAALAEAATGGALVLVVGPEGGFTPDEVERFCARGAQAVSMGLRILRAETACVAAVAAAMSAAGEME